MDHHCPWVDNCVAMHNIRYFLGFIFNLMVGCFYYLFAISLSCFDKDVLNEQSGVLILEMIISSVIGFVMICFNGWNWYLAFKGTTAVDFWQSRK
jgi:hypothetical protein